MFKTIRNAFAIPELRKKLFYTLLIIALYRIGAVMVTVPFVDPSLLTSASNAFAEYINLFTGGGFEKATIFALAISPYITASIIIQLLAVAIPAWEKLSKEGEEGQKKLGQITRITTVIMAAIEGFSYYVYLRNAVGDNGALMYRSGFDGVYAAVVMIVCYIAGSALMMWLAEQINIKGIGNGISIILFAGIVANLSTLVKTFTSAWSYGGRFYAIVPLLVLLILAEIYFVVYMSEAERRIPVQYAKRVVGRKMYGGNSSNIPIKVNMAGVLPVIFANALLSLPTMILGFGAGVDKAATAEAGETVYNGFGKFLSWFSVSNDWSSIPYYVLYVVLIIAFGYFYISITYNPVEMANNLRKNSGAIPGIRPGKPTSDYIARIVSRIVLIGGVFLSIVVLVPTISGMLTGVSLALGGTTVIIIVGVAIETARSLESQMLMRHYKGFLE